MHRHSIQDAADIDQSEVWSPCWWVAVKVAAWEDRIGVEWSTHGSSFSVSARLKARAEALTVSNHWIEVYSLRLGKRLDITSCC